MPRLASSLLIVNHPQLPEIFVGADSAKSWSQADSFSRTNFYRVAVIPLDEDEKMVRQVLDQLNYHNPEIVIVLIDVDQKLSQYQSILQNFELFSVLPSFKDKRCEKTVVDAIEKARQIEQSEELVRLVKQQNRRLKELQDQLQERIDARQKFLEDANKKLANTNYRVQALHKALVAVHRSASTSEMETLLTEALQEALELSWIRIILSSQASLKAKLSHSRRLVSLFNTTLTKEQATLGEVYFARPLESPFTRADRDFLRKIGDTISIALERILKLEELETLQQQWEVTFNAISNPLSIINDQYEIIQTNRSFEQQTGLTSDALVGEKCFRALFDQDQPCKGCTLGENFELGRVNSALGKEFEFSVQSYPIRSNEAIYVNLYQDLSQQRALERRVLHSTKMVEIGTIGSSIAHELNNPIGGIINYLQLIKMDIDKDSDIYEDINEMEQGAQRCKEIVQNLLSFTRKPSVDQKELVSIKEALERAVKIVSLQARSRGISIQFNDTEDESTFEGQKGLFIQCLTNILQNALEAIDEKKKNDRSFRGQIQISRITELDQEKIVITDNGIGIDSQQLARVLNPLYTSKNPNLHSGLGLTLSYQILNEMGGDLELRSEKGQNTTVTVTLLRPVFVESEARN